MDLVVGGASGRLWGARSAPRRATSFGAPRLFRSFGENAQIFVDLGPQLGHKGVPKSPFRVKNQHKIAKESIQEGFQKKHEKLVEKSLKNE